MHAYWLISWIIATLPLYRAYSEWSRKKSRALALLALDREDAKDIDRSIVFLKDLNPLSSAQIFWASVASGVSLVLPLADLVKKA